MRALAKLAPEEGLTLVDRPVPEPGPGEILVRVEAASIGGCSFLRFKHTNGTV